MGQRDVIAMSLRAVGMIHRRGHPLAGNPALAQDVDRVLAQGKFHAGSLIGRIGLCQSWRRERLSVFAEEEMARMVTHGKWSDKWLTHPLPDMREPQKRACWLTDIDILPEHDDADDPVTIATKNRIKEDILNHAANLFLKASLHSVDKFFMQIRRGLTMAERGVVTAASDGRWFGKNAYDPGNLVKLVEIFRVYYNYCEVGDDKKTPAMRMGLAKGPVASEDVLYFTRRVGSV